MRDDSGLHLKSISAQLQREREANVGDVSNCDKPEGKTNDRSSSEIVTKWFLNLLTFGSNFTFLEG